LPSRHGGRKTRAVGMAASAICRLAGTCQFFSDRWRTDSPPPQRQSLLTVRRQILGNYRHEETEPGNHHSPTRKATNSKKRFLTPSGRVRNATSVPSGRNIGARVQSHRPAPLTYAVQVRIHEKGCERYAAVNFTVAINQRLREFWGTM
jgi:hypothetical protein